MTYLKHSTKFYNKKTILKQLVYSFTISTFMSELSSATLVRLANIRLTIINYTFEMNIKYLSKPSTQNHEHLKIKKYKLSYNYNHKSTFRLTQNLIWCSNVCNHIIYTYTNCIRISIICYTPNY